MQLTQTIPEINILDNFVEISAGDYIATYSRPGDFWVGCSDCSFSPARYPGKHIDSFYFHQNIGNMVHPADSGCLFAMQYAIKTESAENIFICGHDDCRIIKSVVEKKDSYGSFYDWMSPVRHLTTRYEHLLATSPVEEQIKFLCRLNVIKQTFNAGASAGVRDAWQRGQPLTVRAVMYDAEKDFFRDLNFSASGSNVLDKQYESLTKGLNKLEELKRIQSIYTCL